MSEPPAFDHRRVIAEIEEEARRLRREAVVSPGFERELDAIFTRIGPPAAAEDFETALSTAEELAYVDAHVPVLSNKPGGSAFKKLVRKTVFFYGSYLADEVTRFSTTIARSVRLLGRRVDGLERAVAGTAPGVREVIDGIDPGPEGVQFVEALAERLDAVDGRVVVGECGRGALLQPLVDRGIDAYGVEPRRLLADDAGTAGLEVREDAVLDHLRLVPPNILGAVVLVGCVDRLPVGTRLELLVEAERVLSAAGLVAVVTGDALDDSGAAVIADLMGEQPLRPSTWRRLLEQQGLTVTEVVVAEGDGPTSALVLGRRAPS
jgi:hypothetical protein